MKAVIFIGSGKISYGKLSQALDYGALTVQIAGDFDDAMAAGQGSLAAAGHLPGQQRQSRSGWKGKRRSCIRVLEALRWQVPDWIVVPGGNLGNSSAFGKAFIELKEIGLIDRVPRLAVINATGANTLYSFTNSASCAGTAASPIGRSPTGYYAELDRGHRRASTIASAIEINRPVNLDKCLRALDVCHGVVREVSDQEILDAKAQVGAGGLGCEPASAASVAGAKLLVAEGVIGPDEQVVCILTGHQLKDPDGHGRLSHHRSGHVQQSARLAAASNGPRSPTGPSPCSNELDEIIKAIQLYS